MTRHTHFRSPLPTFICTLLAGSMLALGGCGNDNPARSAAQVATTGGAAAVRAPTGPAASAATSAPEAASIHRLVQAAVTAYQAGHIVAPASDNAFQYYIDVLHQQPGNRVALDALRESFPFAASDVARAISRDDFAEADREIQLLAAADPGNYTVTTLRDQLATQLAAFQRRHPGFRPAATGVPPTLPVAASSKPQTMTAPVSAVGRGEIARAAARDAGSMAR